MEENIAESPKVAERALFEASFEAFGADPKPARTSEIADQVILEKNRKEEESREIATKALMLSQFEQLKGQFSSKGVAFEGIFDAYESIKSTNLPKFFDDFQKIEANLLKVALSEEKDERVIGSNPSSLKEFQSFKSFFEKQDEDARKRSVDHTLSSLAPDFSKMSADEATIHRFNSLRDEYRSKIRQERRTRNVSSK